MFLLLVVFVIHTAGAITIPFKYPLFKQCNSSWGGDLMEHQTICQVGCLMSSVAMALAGHAIPIGHKLATPATLNEFLRANHGYTSSSALIEQVVDQINPKLISYLGSRIPTSTFSVRDVEAALKTNHTIVIANVDNGHHFVLCTGFDSHTESAGPHGKLYVNDPGFKRSFYTLSEVVGWRLYKMK